MKKIKEFWKKMKYWQIGGIVALFLTFFIPWVGKNLFIGNNGLVEFVLYPSFLLCQITSFVFEPIFCAAYISPFVNVIIGMTLGKIIDIKK